ncbi:MAG: hypothetical protein J6386_20265 [Candidatus Synoicihabitans palmerolidicus]|nr:hypothetical protein [Candidatus Synoicihabitans palmerolidicus]
MRGGIQATRRKTGPFQADAVAKYDFDGVTSQTVFGLAYSRQTAYGRGHAGTLPAVDLDNLGERVYPVYSTAYSLYNANSFTNQQAYINQRLGFMDDRIFVTADVLRYDTKTTGRNVLTNSAPQFPR